MRRVLKGKYPYLLLLLLSKAVEADDKAAVCEQLDKLSIWEDTGSIHQHDHDNTIQNAVSISTRHQNALLDELMRPVAPTDVRPPMELKIEDGQVICFLGVAGLLMLESRMVHTLHALQKMTENHVQCMSAQALQSHVS